MPYRVEVSPRAQKQLDRLDRAIRGIVSDYIDSLEELEDPRSKGKPLVGDLSGLWRYRVGDFRVLCRIEDERLVILVVEIGDRKGIYR